MKLPRRTFLHLVAGAAALPAVPRVAYAQAYPTRPVRIIVTFAAGSANDVNGRLIAQWLSERLGQPPNRSRYHSDRLAVSRELCDGGQSVASGKDRSRVHRLAIQTAASLIIKTNCPRRVRPCSGSIKRRRRILRGESSAIRGLA